jgi:hypothetical protein
MPETRVGDAAPEAVERTIKLVDADVHPAPLPRDLAPRLDARSRERYERYGVRVANPPQL